MSPGEGDRFLGVGVPSRESVCVGLAEPTKEEKWPQPADPGSAVCTHKITEPRTALPDCILLLPPI